MLWRGDENCWLGEAMEPNGAMEASVVARWGVREGGAGDDAGLWRGVEAMDAAPPTRRWLWGCERALGLRNPRQRAVKATWWFLI